MVRGGAVLDADGVDPSVHGVRGFTELVAAEPWLTATAVRTVGGKEHDGFALVTG